MTIVKPGQIWADCDPRSTGRHVRVLEIEDVPARAVVVQCDPRGQVVGKEKRTRIALARFKPTSNGYRLITDVEEQP